MEQSEYEGPGVFGYETDLPAMRVAMISVHTSPLASLGSADAGGMNVYIRELACHLGMLGVEVDIFTRRTLPGTPEVAPLCPGVDVISVKAGPPEPVHKDSLFPLLPQFASEAVLSSVRRGVRYDVVHSHYWLSGWVAHLLRRYWETPFIQMFHTTAHMKESSGNSVIEIPLRAKTERQIIDLADSLVAANPAERADLLWRQRTPTDKVCTVPPGVDLELFSPGDQRSSRKALGIPGDRAVILFVGRVDPIKGIETLLEAIERWPSDGAEPLVVFVGGELEGNGTPVGALADVAALADDLGIAERFSFVGSQPQDKLPLFYRSANVVAVPSKYESFGLVAIEAMACGIPVVASRAGGLAFTIEDGETGYLVPVAEPEPLTEALVRVVGDPNLQRQLGTTARDAALRFSWPAVASSILHMYQRLAEGHRADLCCDEEIYA
ncbi:MAG TPA: glycosyltransferase [Thermomicrobiales bacterium]|nr:glycosyltransferase [Thermomicrobiales bacterium]